MSPILAPSPVCDVRVAPHKDFTRGHASAPQEERGWNSYESEQGHVSDTFLFLLYFLEKKKSILAVSLCFTFFTQINLCAIRYSTAAQLKYELNIRKCPESIGRQDLQSKWKEKQCISVVCLSPPPPQSFSVFLSFCFCHFRTFITVSTTNIVKNKTKLIVFSGKLLVDNMSLAKQQDS